MCYDFHTPWAINFRSICVTLVCVYDIFPPHHFITYPLPSPSLPNLLVCGVYIFLCSVVIFKKAFAPIQPALHFNLFGNRRCGLWHFAQQLYTLYVFQSLGGTIHRRQFVNWNANEQQMNLPYTHHWTTLNIWYYNNLVAITPPVNLIWIVCVQIKPEAIIRLLVGFSLITVPFYWDMPLPKIALIAFLLTRSTAFYSIESDFNWFSRVFCHSPGHTLTCLNSIQFKVYARSISKLIFNHYYSCKSSVLKIKHQTHWLYIDNAGVNYWRHRRSINNKIIGNK